MVPLKEKQICLQNNSCHVLKVYVYTTRVGVAKADSLKETVVRYPYLFGSRGLSVPSSYITSGNGSGVAGAGDNGSLDRKKAISSE